MNLDEQLEAFDMYAARAFELAVDDMMREHAAILALARDRLTEGASLYGDEIWRKSAGVLYDDMLEELADAVNYRVAAMWQRERMVTPHPD